MSRADPVSSLTVVSEKLDSSAKKMAFTGV
jgi:hypothetical protein